jgi:hypothetical protein
MAPLGCQLLLEVMDLPLKVLDLLVVAATGIDVCCSAKAASHVVGLEVKVRRPVCGARTDDRLPRLLSVS